MKLKDYIIILLLCVVIPLMAFFAFKKDSDTNPYSSKIDSLNTLIVVLKTKFDSLTPVENHYKTEITNIKKYYYNEKIKIDSIPDSNLVRWIRADLRNFDSSGTPYSR